MAEPLAAPRSVLFAALLAAVQEKPGKRLSEPPGATVKPERGLADDAA
jgi:hypothetical protein